jgi:hypothetical protein
VVQGDGEVEAVLTGTAEDLVLTLSHEESLGVLLRSGQVRYIIAREAELDGHRAQRCWTAPSRLDWWRPTGLRDTEETKQRRRARRKPGHRPHVNLSVSGLLI